MCAAQIFEVLRMASSCTGGDGDARGVVCRSGLAFCVGQSRPARVPACSNHRKRHENGEADRHRDAFAWQHRGGSRKSHWSEASSYLNKSPFSTYGVSACFRSLLRRPPLVLNGYTSSAAPTSSTEARAKPGQGAMWWLVSGWRAKSRARASSKSSSNATSRRLDGLA
mgnify:CR=1 FL=1